MFKFILAIFLFSGTAFAFEGYNELKLGAKLDLSKLPSSWSKPTKEVEKDGLTSYVFDKGLSIEGRQLHTRVFVHPDNEIYYFYVATDWSILKHMFLMEYLEKNYKLHARKGLSTEFEGGQVILEASEDADKKGGSLFIYFSVK